VLMLSFLPYLSVSFSLTPCGKIAFNMETSDASPIQVQITLESSQITQYLATLGISLY